MEKKIMKQITVAVYGRKKLNKHREIKYGG